MQKPESTTASHFTIRLLIGNSALRLHNGSEFTPHRESVASRARNARRKTLQLKQGPRSRAGLFVASISVPQRVHNVMNARLRWLQSVWHPRGLVGQGGAIPATFARIRNRTKLCVSCPCFSWQTSVAGIQQHAVHDCANTSGGRFASPESDRCLWRQQLHCRSKGCKIEGLEIAGFAVCREGFSAITLLHGVARRPSGRVVNPHRPYRTRPCMLHVFSQIHAQKTSSSTHST